MNHTVFVKLFPAPGGVAVNTRYRCGMRFDPEGRMVSVSAEQLAQLKVDPWLIVTDAPMPEGNAEKAAPEGDKPDKAAKADKNTAERT